MLLILTGPAGAGKNTVGHILAQLREKCAVVDADDVRHMAIKPHIAPDFLKNIMEHLGSWRSQLTYSASNFIML